MVEKIRSNVDNLSIHPIVGFAMIVVDLMLFGGEVFTVGVSWPISIGVAVVLTIASALIQKNVYGDNWGAAIGKSLIVGLLTAIPTPLSTVLPTIGLASHALLKK